MIPSLVAVAVRVLRAPVFGLAVRTGADERARLLAAAFTGTFFVLTPETGFPAVFDFVVAEFFTGGLPIKQLIKTYFSLRRIKSDVTVSELLPVI